MDVTASNFNQYLPWILYELATCSFVSLDLEMSGIAICSKHLGSRPLQKHYEENKAAAEKYQILQIGMTICHEDKVNGGYKMKPYNIWLNPCLDRNLNVNRDFTFMGWSMDFLTGHGFDAGNVFTKGIRYLSRDEEDTVREEAIRRWSPQGSFKNLDGRLRDEANVRFLQAVRLEIKAWTDSGKSRTPFLNIPSSENGVPSKFGLPRELDSSQKWLVHNLVKAEYPSMKTRGMPTYVQIEQRSGGAMDFDERMKESNLRIRKHVGFRWIVEALAGGDLSTLDASTFLPLMQEEQDPSITVDVLADRVKNSLQENRPILVGHNNFTDLIYLYQTFLGALPNKIEDFITLIHHTFPILMDTKYLATLDFDSANPSSSLEELNKTLAKIRTPKINVEGPYSKYMYTKTVHEAGYDSMLTAIAFLKLATHLENGKLPKGMRGRLEEIAYDVVAPIDTVVPDLFPEKRSRHKAPFTNFFDTLIETQPRPQPSVKPLADTDDVQVQQKIKKGLLIPRISDTFWRSHANKLRVFGSIEKTVCCGAPGQNKRFKRKHKAATMAADTDIVMQDRGAASNVLLIED
ncbi:Uncharacterized protein PECH_007619 [Penicillium ucsense]|uniref:Uncharacterized protein n=1 Tax=Penicillium ucsense TaxID=2839758 RepID=A0A8J8WL31_9EURO|nr:Uncharacterized protein PECM_004073 [Penicillium ucsense]KAF7738910.1 Uncharacterized protein PECH_007619 [Penicillium ucsense]